MTDDIGDDLKITKVIRHEWGPGKWVFGRFTEHRFEALLFPKHADNASYELGDSRISKLWIQRLSDQEPTFSFDRGLVIDAQDEPTKGIVAFLCAGLADHIYSK